MTFLASTTRTGVITLRGYQKEALNALWNYFKVKKGNPIVALPTGTGKSIIIAEWVQKALSMYPSTRVMMLTHVKELVEQNADKMLKLWPTAPLGIYSSGLNKKDTVQPVIFGGVDSAVNKIDDFGVVHMLLIDECHLVNHADNTRYQKIIACLRSKNEHLKVIGFTATPYRLGLGLLTEGDIFTDVCYDATGMEKFNKLIDDGYLCPLIPKRTKSQLDVSGVRIHAGEYVLSDLQTAVNTVSNNAGAIDEIVESTWDRHACLIFTTGIEHTEAVYEELASRGLAASFIHSKIKSKERDARLNDFKAGKIKYMVNANVLIAGFDYPALDCLALLRPTQSVSLYVQAVGRGTRIFPGKESCLVLDFAGNTARLGPVNDPVLPRGKKSKGSGDAPVRLCDECSTYFHAALQVCPVCGKLYPHDKEKGICSSASELELIAKNEPPVVTMFPVDKIEFDMHVKEGKPDSLKIEYTSGLRRFREWVCLEHGGFATSKARRLWTAFGGGVAPKTTFEALQLSPNLKKPIEIGVILKRGKTYDEVVQHVFEPEAAPETTLLNF